MLDWALTQGETEVAGLLRDAGATSNILPPPPSSPPAKPQSARVAVAKAVALLEPIGAIFNQKTGCISCHNETLPGVAMKIAGERGIPVSPRAAAHPAQATRLIWSPDERTILFSLGPSFNIFRMSLQDEGDAERVIEAPTRLHPEMTMRYVDVALTDLQREFQMARAKPRHLIPQPKTPPTSIRSGLTGVLDSIVGAHHVLEMFRRTLPDNDARKHLDRLSNRLTKILAELRKLTTP